MTTRATANSLTQPTTTLAASVSIGASSCTLTADPGTEMPSGASIFSVVIGETVTDQEIIDCTRSTTTLTFIGTATKAHDSGASVNIVFSKNDYDNFVQDDELATHSADTTGVHGIADTSVLLTTSHDGAATAHASATNLVHTTGTETIGGAKSFSAAVGFVNGTAAAVGAWFRAVGNGIYSSAANTLDFATNGVRRFYLTTTQAVFASSVKVRPTGGIELSNKVEFGCSFAYYTMGGGGAPMLAVDLLIGETTMEVDDQSLFVQTTYPRYAELSTGEKIAIIANTGTNLFSVQRGILGSTEADAYAGIDQVQDASSSGNNYADHILPTNGPNVTIFSGVALNANVTIWTPPKSTVGLWVAPTISQSYRVVVKDCAGFTMTIKEPVSSATVATITGDASGRGAAHLMFDSNGVLYLPLGAYP